MRRAYERNNWGNLWTGILRLSNPLLEIPIREISDNEQNPFVKLVDHILVTKRASPQADTSTLGREIDKIVYELYGLTDPLPASPKFQKRGI